MSLAREAFISFRASFAKRVSRRAARNLTGTRERLTARIKHVGERLLGFLTREEEIAVTELAAAK